MGVTVKNINIAGYLQGEFPQVPSVPVVANFTATPTSGTVPLAVNFTDTSTGTPTSWLWDFKNDGTATSTLQNPTYTYSAPGTYSVKLTASNSAGVSTATSLNLISASQSMDPQFNYTSMLLGGQGSNNQTNATFLDSSSNNFTVTNVGTVTQGSFSPFGVDAGYWSNYFDGSGDSLTAPAGSAFAYGTGDFTVEAWIYPTATNASNAVLFSQTVSGTNYFSLWFNANQTISFIGTASGGGSAINGPTTVPLNKWSHVAVVRNSGTVTVYVNGVGGTPTSNTLNLTNTTYVPTIGAYTHAGTNNYTGYISNFRIVKGSAVYTSNFTPSTIPLTAVSGTSLLTCQSNRFIDNRVSGFTLTVNGDTAVSSFGPFVPVSQYAVADGGAAYLSNSYVSVANNVALNFGTGSFTVECWVYVPTGRTAIAVWGKWATLVDNYLLRFDSNKFVFYYNGGSITQSDTTPYNAWTHVAVVRNGTAINLYVNGVSKGSASSAFDSNTNTAFAMGAYGSDLSRFTGYIANLRVVKGSAVYTSDFTVPTAPVTAISGTSLLLNSTNAGMFDSTGKSTVTGFGDVKISTAQKKYGSSSMLFDGSGDYLSTVVANSNFQLRSGDFTIEMWIRPSVVNVTQAVFDQRNPNNQDAGFAIYIANTGVPIVGTANINYITSASALSANTWYHIAVCRSGNDMKLFVDGTQVGSTYNASSRDFTNSITLIGSGANGAFNGYIQDFRFTKGYARYTSSGFTPPGQLTS